jgi:ABC-2 type transport system ATP-binding protein
MSPPADWIPLMQKTFFELITAENKNGATVLFSSHILSEVQRLCDRVAIIKEGRNHQRAEHRWGLARRPTKK